MAAFCTIADMASFLQITIEAGNASATRAIAEASAAIQDYCEQQIELVEDDELTLDIEAARAKIFLPELPVTEIRSVVENGVTLAAENYVLGMYGVLHRIGAYWYPGIQIVTVTYSHGYAVVPAVIADVCTRAASRAYQSGLRAAALGGVTGIQAQSIGDYSVQYGGETSSGDGMLGASAAPILLPSEKVMLNRYRLRRP